MANKHRKTCSASHPQGSTNESNKDATTPLLEQSKPRTPTPPTADEHREQEELLFIINGNAKWYSYSGKQFGGFLQKETYSFHSTQKSHSMVLPKGKKNLGAHKRLYEVVCITFIHNCEDMEETKMSFSV